MSDQSSSVRSPRDDSCESSGRRKAVPTGDYIVGSSTAEESALPESFGRYEVRRLFDSGGFGAVYLGYDTQLQRDVAIKVPFRRAAQTAGGEDRRLQEARRLAQLRHPGIVTVHDVGVQDGQCYIVSDFIQGASLHQWLIEHEPTWQQTARIVAAVAEALAHAHASGVVHRDVKAGNIILTDNLTPVLVDFGLAITESEVTEPQRGSSSGTPKYMSPEQTRGRAHRIDGRTDIYSLGVVLYYMLCGQFPFRAKAVDELVREIREDEPQPPRQLDPEIPAELERICLKALSKSLRRRYSNATDLATDLHRVLSAAKPDQRSPAKRYLPSQTDPGSGTLQWEHAGAKVKSKSREAERRQVTLVYAYCELTARGEPLDPEERLAILQECQSICEDAVAHMKGTIVPSAGKGHLMCFGYPAGYEDAARRAVLTGMGILEALRPVQTRLQRKQIELASWVTVHTGLALVGAIGQERHHELSIVGEVRDVVSRMDTVAPPEGVVITEATYRLVHGYFLFDDLGTQQIRGVAEPIKLRRVAAESDAYTRIDVAETTGLTPLVGREHEVGLLIDRWSQVADGTGQVVMLVGEAGIGKSRLIRVLRRHVSKTPAGERPVVEWRGSPRNQNSVLYPAIEFFNRSLRLDWEDSAEVRLDRLRGHLEQLELGSPELVSLFAALLSIPTGHRYPTLDLSRQRLKEKTLEALLDWFRESSARQPLLFVVEDLHWIDASTLELLGMLMEQTPAQRMLILLAFRPEFKPPWTEWSHQTRVAVNRLNRQQVEEMMRAQLGVHSLPPSIVERIVDRTDGVPLFVEEFTKMVAESGVLSEVEGSAGPSGALPLNKIPDTLYDLLIERLDRMPNERDIVQLGATLGREFSYELLQAVSPLSEPQLQSGLEKLLGAELLYPKGVPPRCRYLFKHSLIQEAAYQSLPRSKRQRFHASIARALEKQSPETAQTQPELLAHHYTEAGMLKQAIPFWEQAGLRSQRRSANQEAVAQLNSGLALVQRLDESEERDRLELKFQLPLGAALLATRGYAAQEVGTVYDRARELCERSGSPEDLFSILWGTWAWRVVRDELDICMELSAETMRLAESLGDAGTIMEAHFVPALTLFYRGDFAGSCRHSERGMAYYDTARCQQHAGLTGQNSGVTLQCYHAWSLWLLGYPDQAFARIKQAVELAEERAHPFSLAYALGHLGRLQEYCRMGRQARQTAMQVISIATEQGFVFWQAVGKLTCARTLLLEGQYEEAIALQREALASYRGAGAELSLPYFYTLFVEAYGKLGRIREARDALGDALTLVEKSNERFCEAELYRLEGELLLADKPNDPAGAEKCFRRSLDVAHHQQAKTWQLRTTMSLCRLKRTQGRSDEARQMLADVYHRFTEGLRTPDLVEAKRLLDDLS